VDHKPSGPGSQVAHACYKALTHCHAVYTKWIGKISYCTQCSNPL